VSSDISLDEKRRIAEKASAALNSLGPLSPRNAEKLSVLSKAIYTATNKASLNLYSVTKHSVQHAARLQQRLM
jgi:hypothetical protein